MDRLSVRLRTYLWSAQMKGLRCDCMVCIAARIDKAYPLPSFRALKDWPKWAPKPKPPKENA